MHRLFVAIRPPVEIRDRLIDLMDGVRDARWQDDEQLHLTLRFIGEVDRHMAEDVAAALGGIDFPAFEIRLGGVGRFDSGGRRGSLWAGVAPQGELKALHKKVDAALTRIGIEPDRRAFLPHITIARFGRVSAPINGFVAEHGGLSSAPFPVDHFCLFESTLSRSGAHYDIVARYALS